MRQDEPAGLLVGVVVSSFTDRSFTGRSPLHPTTVAAALASHTAVAMVIDLQPPPTQEASGTPDVEGDSAPSTGGPECVSSLDVLLVDHRAGKDAGALPAAVRDAQLADIPVVLLLSSPGQLAVERCLSLGIADVVFSAADASCAVPLDAGAGIEELVYRLQVVCASRSHREAVERTSEELRAEVRSVSAAMAAYPDNYDIAALSQIYLKGIAQAFGADGARLHLFDEEQTGLVSEHWPPGPTAPSAARVGAALEIAGRVVGSVELTQDNVPLPWTELQSSLLQHVSGNYLQAMRQARLHARTAEAVERLSYLNFLKDDFIATINHEFRSPLATITGHLELLADGILGPIAEGQREALDIVLRNTARLNSLVESIRTVSALEHPSSRHERVDLTDVVTTVVEAMKTVGDAKNMLITTSVPSYPVPVHGHRGQLVEALRNVLQNSITFTPARGTITLTLVIEPPSAPSNSKGGDSPGFGRAGSAVMTVQDTGSGISATDLPHLFTSFYRGSNVKRTSLSGAGLGLTITKQILDRHEGAITIESTPHHSTTVTMVLPLLAPPAGRADTATRTLTPRPGDAPCT